MQNCSSYNDEQLRKLQEAAQILGVDLVNLPALLNVANNPSTNISAITTDTSSQAHVPTIGHVQAPTLIPEPNLNSSSLESCSELPPTTATENCRVATNEPSFALGGPDYGQVIPTASSNSLDIPWDFGFGCDIPLWDTLFHEFPLTTELASDLTNTDIVERSPASTPFDPFATCWTQNPTSPHGPEQILPGSKTSGPMRSVNGKNSKRKPYDPEARRQTHETRKRGNCIRCSMNRKRVTLSPEVFAENENPLMITSVNLIHIISMVHVLLAKR